LGIAIAALIGVPGVSEATNGYFAHSTGTCGKALAGAITALPQECHLRSRESGLAARC
jgi:hypothetical protein